MKSRFHRYKNVKMAKMCVYCSCIRDRRYLPNLYVQAHNHYTMLCSPLVALHWHRNGWPWMTFNGHFALKSGSSFVSNGLAFWLSEKTVWKFQICRCTHILLAATKKLAQRLYWWYKCYGVIHWRYPKRKRQTSGLYSHSVLTRPVSDSPTVFSLACGQFSLAFLAEREKRLWLALSSGIHGRWTVHPPPKTTMQTPCLLWRIGPT